MRRSDSGQIRESYRRVAFHPHRVGDDGRPGTSVVQSQSPLSNTLYLPLVADQPPWYNPLSAETFGDYLADPVIQRRVNELQMSWVRVTGLRWRDVEPVEGGYQWDHPRTQFFESFLITASQLGLKPTVIIEQSPRWATILPTSCSAIRQDKLDEFANYLTAVVNRYKQPPYNVHSWELFNEPDVDPSLVGEDSGYGCWGDINDPYYGGERFGEMLQVAAPAIRAADPTATIVFGGLLLAEAETANPALGHPERFLQGALVSGAADAFDVVSYHVHHQYVGPVYNYGGAGMGGSWDAWGGVTKGKPNYLNSVMANYGVSKALWMNEGALRCPSWHPDCVSNLSLFLDTQGQFVPRELSRTLSVGVRQFSWYTLQWSLWDEVGLLNYDGTPRPAFTSYKSFVERVRGTSFPRPRSTMGAGWKPTVSKRPTIRTLI